MDEITPDGTPKGLSRRDMLRRSALVGGTVIWMAPAVQTLAAPAFADGSTSEENPPCDEHSGGISYVVALIQCGNTYYLTKWDDTDPKACGADANVSSDDDFCTTGLNALKAKAGAALVGGCAPGVKAGSNCNPAAPSCDLEIVLPAGCSLAGYVLHDGSIQTRGDGHKCIYDTGSGLMTNGGDISGFTLPTVGSIGTVCFDKS